MFFVSYAKVGIDGRLVIENGMTEFPSSLTTLKQIRQWETEMAEQLEVDHVTLLTFQEMKIANTRITEGVYTHRQVDPAGVWEIKHGLNTLLVAAKFINEQNHIIEADITVLDADTIRAVFPRELAGTAMIG